MNDSSGTVWENDHHCPPAVQLVALFATVPNVRVSSQPTDLSGCTWPHHPGNDDQPAVPSLPSLLQCKGLHPLSTDEKTGLHPQLARCGALQRRASQCKTSSHPSRAPPCPFRVAQAERDICRAILISSHPPPAQGGARPRRSACQAGRSRRVIDRPALTPSCGHAEAVREAPPRRRARAGCLHTTPGAAPGRNLIENSFQQGARWCLPPKPAAGITMPGAHHGDLAPLEANERPTAADGHASCKMAAAGRRA